MVGVAAATTDVGAIATAGTAELLAGAVSMALGVYVSVSTQRDSGQALIAQETDELRRMPDEELTKLGQLPRLAVVPPQQLHPPGPTSTRHGRHHTAERSES